ncbi:MAG: TonB-dependent receptor [Pseudomonadota bacterium]|nr:TonB-dependent receptor [Pseudomonadota bacterium]
MPSRLPLPARTPLALRLRRFAAAPSLSLLIALASADEPAHVEAGAMANPAASYELPTVQVISTAPLPGMGVTLDKVPSNVQTLSRQDLEGHGYDNLSEALSGALGNVNINDTQGNPYQVDVNVRGFTASPLLGTPQGLSVFVDGVRVNETFGDVVNWDLIPQNAIANVTLLPGANPQFGLNTLGGALSVVTKSGFQFPGTRVDLSGGNAGRRQFELESGGHGEAIDWFVAANDYRDDGWADHNPSEVRQLFAKTGFQDDDTDVDLSLSLADNRLHGNQTIPLSYMGDTRQVYTWPDEVDNRLAALQLKASQYFGHDLLVAGNVYWRRVQTDVLNSNTSVTGFGVDAGGNPLPCSASGPALPACPNAQNIYNAIDQYTSGASVQLSETARLWSRENTAIAGLSLDRGRTAFRQSSQDAIAAADRSTFSSSPITLGVAVTGQSDYTGLYASDTWSAQQDLTLTVSGRYNRARVSTRYDYYDPTQYNPAPQGGDFTYTRFNPALGLNWKAASATTTYASYTEGMRAPTPVELSCADPSVPCALPNAFSSDPYLRMVVSRTLELGARGDLDGWRWSAAVYQTRLQDDILFVATSPVAGYFTNVGDTQRRGLELGLDRKDGHWNWGAHYSHIDATYQSAFEELVAANSAADPATGLVQVAPGARIPGIPRHLLKLQARYTEGESWSLGASLVAQTETYARGDEANRDVNGTVPGFAVLNLDGRLRLDEAVELSVHVRNLFDRRYATFGALATNYFNQPGHGFDNTATGSNEQFRTIGAPRALWLTLTWWIDRQQAPAGGPDRD